MTDQEMYEAMENYKVAPLEEDEKLTEEEFLGWVNLKMPDGKNVTIFAGNTNLKK